MKKLATTVLGFMVLWFIPLTASASSGSIRTVFQVATAAACAEKGLQCSILDVSRTEIGHKLSYYRVLIKVGAGDFDVIAVNRVVREVRSGVPIGTKSSFFYIHGSNGSFYQGLLAPHDSHGLGVYLGEHNFDVWGIDLRNVQIPADTTVLPTAHDWGFALQIKDVSLATRIARYVRALTGQGIGRIVLAGHSAGAALAYAVANAEAVLPAPNRDIGGLIPIDMVYKLPPSAVDQSQFSCNIAGFYKSVNDSGLYFFNNLTNIDMGKLANTDPNGVSPYRPPLTNLQLVLTSVSGLGFAPFYPYHLWAVVRDPSGTAVDSRYTQARDIVQRFLILPPYQIPNAMIADMFAPSCATLDSPYDDNLDKVRLPVLYIGAAGGMGKLGEYTLSVLGSKDTKAIMIQLLPNDDAANDFGHMEAFTATDAQQLVWEPIRLWIVQHQIH